MDVSKLVKNIEEALKAIEDMRKVVLEMRKANAWEASALTGTPEAGSWLQGRIDVLEAAIVELLTAQTELALAILRLVRAV